MSTIFTTTTSALITTILDAGITLPILGINDDADGVNLSQGFLLLDVEFRNNTQVTINGTVSRKVRVRGAVTVHICVPMNTGTKQALEIADVLHSTLSSQRFNHIFCYPGVVDSRYQIAYSKGEYWNTPFRCNFYIEEYI